jgi:hypothetical protein
MRGASKGEIVVGPTVGGKEFTFGPHPELATVISTAAPSKRPDFIQQLLA